MASQQGERTLSKESNARERRREQNRLAQRNFRRRKQELHFLRRLGKQKNEESKVPEVEQSTNGNANHDGTAATQPDTVDFETLLSTDAVNGQLSAWDLTLYGDIEHTRLEEQILGSSLLPSSSSDLACNEIAGVETTSSIIHPLTPPMSVPASFSEIACADSDSGTFQCPLSLNTPSRSASLLSSQHHSPTISRKPTYTSNKSTHCTHRGKEVSCSHKLEWHAEPREAASTASHISTCSHNHHSPLTGKTTLHIGRTALHYASAQGHAEVIGILLEAGADIDAVDEDGWTALHVAADCGHIDVLMLLVNDGADLNAAVGSSTSKCGCAGGS